MICHREHSIDAISRRILPGGRYGLQINVHGHDAAGAKLACCDGKDARAATEVEHRQSIEPCSLEPFEAKRGRLMRTCSKSKSRVQPDNDPVRIRCRGVARDNQALATQVNALLAQWKSDGSLQQSMATWIP